jgi:hypothetical protein
MRMRAKTTHGRKSSSFRIPDTTPREPSKGIRVRTKKEQEHEHGCMLYPKTPQIGYIQRPKGSPIRDKQKT